MSRIQQIREPVAENCWLLAYMHHMAQTAQPTASKRLFDLFAQQETQRIERNNGLKLPSFGHGIARDKTLTEIKYN